MLVSVITATAAAIAAGAWLRWSTVPVRAAFRLGRAAALTDRRTP